METTTNYGYPIQEVLRRVLHVPGGLDDRRRGLLLHPLARRLDVLNDAADPGRLGRRQPLQAALQFGEEVGEMIERVEQPSHPATDVVRDIDGGAVRGQRDLGIAVGTGTQIAQDSADLVLLGDRLEGLPEALPPCNIN